VIFLDQDWVLELDATSLSRYDCHTFTWIATSFVSRTPNVVSKRGLSPIIRCDVVIKTAQGSAAFVTFFWDSGVNVGRTPWKRWVRDLGPR